MPNAPFDNIETRYLREYLAQLPVGPGSQVVGTDLTAVAGLFNNASAAAIVAALTAEAIEPAISARIADEPTVIAGVSPTELMSPLGTTQAFEHYAVSVVASRFIQAGDPDDTASINRAIEYVHARGGGTVHIRKNSIVATQTGTVNLPGDDGTVKAGFGTALPPESVVTMGYCIRGRGTVRLIGEHFRQTQVLGPWTVASGVNTSQLIGICYPEEGVVAPPEAVVKNLNFRGFFIGIMARSSFVGAQITDNNFKSCGIPILGPASEQGNFQRNWFEDCLAGITLGGWWLYRNDSFKLANVPNYWAPSVSDKNNFSSIRWATRRVFGAVEAALDTFFDTYFYKTANNVTRLSSPLDGASVAIIAPYEGICGQGSVYVMSRYGRGQYNNQANTVFTFGAARAVMNIAVSFSTEITQVYAERIGFVSPDTYLTSGIFGVSVADPWLGSRPRAGLRGFSHFGAFFNNIKNAYFDPIASAMAIDEGEVTWENAYVSQEFATPGIPNNKSNREFFSQRIGVGANESTNVVVRAEPSATVDVDQTVFQASGIIPASATNSFVGFRTLLTVAAGATLPALFNMFIGNPAKLAGAVITNLYGVRISDLTAGVMNYGIHSLITAGSGKWFLYGNGNASSRLNGQLGLGRDPSFPLDVEGPMRLRLGMGATQALSLSTDFTFEAVSNTQVRIKMRGDDLVDRSFIITLS